jgi:hypothetical protein
MKPFHGNPDEESPFQRYIHNHGKMGFLLTFLSERFSNVHNGLFAHRGIRSLIAAIDRLDGIKEKLYKEGGVSNHKRFFRQEISQKGGETSGGRYVEDFRSEKEFC